MVHNSIAESSSASSHGADEHVTAYCVAKWKHGEQLLPGAPEQRRQVKEALGYFFARGFCYDRRSRLGSASSSFVCKACCRERCIGTLLGWHIYRAFAMHGSNNHADLAAH